MNLESFENIEQLQEQLNKAKENAQAAKLIVESTAEHQAFIKAANKVTSLEIAIKEELDKQALIKVQKIKAEILEAGFEERYGHKTSSSCDAWQSDNGESYAIVIVHRTRPRIMFITEGSNGVSVECHDSFPFNDDWIIGHGENVDEAWEEAIDNWGSRPNSTREAALADL